MSFKQLVCRNVTRNGRAYLSYFFSSLFSVMVFFIFALLFFHPELKSGVKASSEAITVLATAGLGLAQILTAVMSVIFLGYSFRIFLKSRKRDFSIYLILGMSEKNLRQMIFWENSLLGLSSISLGLVLGVFFSKAILLISQNILAIQGGLRFYLPVGPALLTFVVYFLIFLFLAILTTIKLQTENLAEMTKDDVKAETEPKTSKLLNFLSVLIIIAGYSAALLFSYGYRSGHFTEIALLWVCVLLTTLGTYLFFQQNGIGLFKQLRKGKLFFRKGNFLAISKLIYRMKANASMYFLIAIVAAVAFVGVGVTLSLGGSDFAGTQDSTFAYVYNTGYLPKNVPGIAYHQRNIKLIENRIKEGGFEVISLAIKPVWLSYQNGSEQEEWGIGAIPVSQFNELAQFNDEKELNVPDNRSVLILASNNTDVNQIKSRKVEEVYQPTMARFWSEGKEESIDYAYSPVRFNIAMGEIGLVSDTFYQELLVANQLEMEENQLGDFVDVGTQVVHYREWAQGGDVDSGISRKLDALESANQKAQEELYATIGHYDSDIYTEEERLAFDKVNEFSFYYTSLYSTWLQTKQGNGVILLISMLLGAVFFSFASCIIYFRLFGELEKDGAYHRSLHILGVSRKIRHQVVTKEMLVMYYAPIIIAVSHFGVAMIAFSQLIELPILTYFINIIGSYTLFQTLFFFVSRWRYLYHLDLYAEGFKALG